MGINMVLSLHNLYSVVSITEFFSYHTVLSLSPCSSAPCPVPSRPLPGHSTAPAMQTHLSLELLSLFLPQNLPAPAPRSRCLLDCWPMAA